MAFPRFRFERIAPHHVVRSFRSDHTYIDSFLWKDALREEREDLSRTYLLLDSSPVDSGDAIAGFFSLKADAQWTTGLPGEESPRYLPVVELMFLARHRRLRGKGIGDALMLRAFQIAVSTADHIGIAGIYLAATAEGLRLYERHQFLRFEGGGKRMFLPMHDIRAFVDAMAAETPDVPS